ncbi:MAG: translation elongation factor Ts [Bacteroidales bacterium]|nr:translation elongation factor Ts [Bacteroidales bacterium]
MAKITAAEVNKLRQQTGAGMMDCKKALVEADGDYNKAIEYLRKKGQKLAHKRADKAANEGVIIAKTNKDRNFGAIIMLNCETDFVAKNQEFVDFANHIVDKAVEEQPKSLDEFKNLQINTRSIDESITDLIGKTGEKMTLAKYEYVSAERVFEYNHHGNSLATLVGFNKAGIENIDEAGNEIAMQVAAMDPLAVDKDGVPKEEIDKEIALGKEQAIQEGKPEQLAEKIAQGKLNKFFKENTLLNQEFVKEGKITVRQYLDRFDKELTVADFKRLKLGD